MATVQGHMALIYQGDVDQNTGVWRNSRKSRLLRSHPDLDLDLGSDLTSTPSRIHKPEQVLLVTRRLCHDRSCRCIAFAAIT